MSANMYLATLAWLSLVAGWFLRKKRRLHIPLVLNGIFLDMSLVLYLEMTRGAVETAVSFKLGAVQQLHVGVSTVALILYCPVLWLGYRLFHEPENIAVRKNHRGFAQTALLFRTLGFLLMFSMWHG